MHPIELEPQVAIPSRRREPRWLTVARAAGWFVFGALALVGLLTIAVLVLALAGDAY